ncbi:bifunctional DNA primase/polymerase [Enterocloster citroniae]
MEGNMKQWALHYAGMGMAVFPIKPRSKQPLTDHGLKDASKDPAQIESWWSRWPTANIGIATGAVSGGLVVIDLDVDKDKGIDGRVTLREWEAEHEKLPNSTWLAITGRGGYHYFYHDTSTVRNRTGIYEGVDIRGDGGYVVAPPSIHPNGNTYEWEQDPMLYPLAEASGAVFDFLVGPVMKDPETIPFEIPEQIPDGQRTTTMVKLVCSQQAKGLSDDAIMAAVRAENEAKCVPPLTDQELKKEVFPALTRYQKGTAPYTATYDHKTRSFQPIIKKGLVNLVSMDTVEEKEPEWLVTDYIPRGQITVLAGDGGSGKTTVWCSIAAAVSSGGQCFLNQDNPFAKNCVPGRVLFFSSEDSAEYTLKGRLRRSGAKLENVLSLDLADERFPEIKFNAPLLEDLIKEHRPELVIFDPLQSYVPPDIQMGQRNAMRACLNPLIGLGEKYGTTFIIIVHTNKQAGLWGRKRIADSADIWDIARSVLIAGEANDGLRYISQEKSNYGPLAQTVLFRLDSGKVEFEGYTDKKDKDYVTAAAATYQAPAREDAKAFILDYLKDGEKETADLDGMMKAMGISKGTLERAKAELKKDGQIVYFSRGFKPKVHYCKLTNPIPSGTVRE